MAFPTADEVIGAYRARKLQPDFGHTDLVDGKCCAIGALTQDAGPFDLVRIFAQRNGLSLREALTSRLLSRPGRLLA